MNKLKFLITIFVITSFLLVLSAYAKVPYKCPFNKIENVSYYKPVEIEIIRDGNNFVRLTNIGNEPINLTTISFHKESLNKNLLSNEYVDICLMFPGIYIISSTEGEVVSFLVTEERGPSPYIVWASIISLFLVFFMIFKKIRKAM